MDYKDFMELRTDQRDARLAEFLTANKDNFVYPIPGAAHFQFFDMTISFRRIPAGNEHDVVAWLQHEGRNVATARHRDGEWFPSNTPLDTAREMFVQIQTSSAAAEHAANMARRLRNQLINSVLWEVGYKPETGDEVIVLAEGYFGERGEIAHIFEPNADRKDPIYEVRLGNGHFVSVYYVMPPFPDPKESADVG